MPSARSRPSAPAKPKRSKNGRSFAVVCTSLPQRPAPVRAGFDHGLPLYARVAGRLSLPPSAELLGICRSGIGTFRPLGRRLDDLGAASTLPAVGHLGPRFRARGVTGKIALVYAVALRPMARNEFGAILAESMIPKSGYRFSDQIIQNKVLPNRTRQGVEQRPVRPLPAFVGSDDAARRASCVIIALFQPNENAGQH